MASIFDLATQLIPAGQVTTSQDFPALRMEPRRLPTCHWVIAMTTPPAAAATFTLAVASTAGGAYNVIAQCVWPAGTSGTKHLVLGVPGNLAQVINNQSAWLRASVTLSGPLTLAGSWITKASDGGVGLASRSYTLDNVNAI